MHDIYAIIPARGGSKGIKGKNLRKVGGMSLLARTIDSLHNNTQISGLSVSTDNLEIADEAKLLGVHVIDRPKQLSNDKALMSDVLVHAIETLKNKGINPSYFLLLQPTSPMRTSTHIKQCIDNFFNTSVLYVSAMSVCQVEHHPDKMLRYSSDGRLQPWKSKKDLERPRQELTNCLRQNGAIYIVEKNNFLKERSFFLEPLMPFEMDIKDSVDIDQEYELELANILLGNKVFNLSGKAVG